jgi:hypothetical protein
MELTGIAAFTLILTVITPSAAQTQSSPGWVLWKRVTQVIPVRSEPQWEPLVAFERLTECRASGIAKAEGVRLESEIAARELRAANEPAPDEKVTVLTTDNTQPFAVVISPRTKTATNITFLCFPGTLDPRPPTR